MEKSLTIKEIARQLCDGLNMDEARMLRVERGLEELKNKYHISLTLLNEMCWEDSSRMFDMLSSSEYQDNGIFKVYEKDSFTLAELIRQCNDYMMSSDCTRYRKDIQEVNSAEIGKQWKLFLESSLFHDAIGKLVAEEEDYIVVAIEY